MVVTKNRFLSRLIFHIDLLLDWKRADMLDDIYEQVFRNYTMRSRIKLEELMQFSNISEGTNLMVSDS